MSVSMYWYKPPSEKKELGSSYGLKWPLAERYGQHDGSCYENFILGENDLPFLEGIEAASKYPEVTNLIADIRRYGSVEVEYK